MWTTTRWTRRARWTRWQRRTWRQRRTWKRSWSTSKWWKMWATSRTRWWNSRCWRNLKYWKSNINSFFSLFNKWIRLQLHIYITKYCILIDLSFSKLKSMTLYIHISTSFMVMDRFESQLTTEPLRAFLD